MFLLAILNGLKLNIVPGREETRSPLEGNSSCFQPVMEKWRKKIAKTITTMDHKIKSLAGQMTFLIIDIILLKYI